jgi:Glycosyl hydrolases family 2
MSSNRIRSVQFHDRLLNPAEAELWLNVTVERPREGELRGRLMGPRCRYASTVEVAYPVRQRPAATVKEGTLGLRVLIPEPSYWDPESPFLYEGPLELWEVGQRVHEIKLRHGFRVLNLGPRGLYCNGRAVGLRGVRITAVSDEEALRLRAAGYNLFLTPVREETAGVWDVADRLGFLVLGEVDDPAGSGKLSEVLGSRPSSLGWVRTAKAPADPLPLRFGQVAGRRWERKLLAVAPGELVVCAEELLPELGALENPKLVIRHGAPPLAEEPVAGVLGWINVAAAA